MPHPARLHALVLFVPNERRRRHGIKARRHVVITRDPGGAGHDMCSCHRLSSWPSCCRNHNHLPEADGIMVIVRHAALTFAPARQAWYGRPRLMQNYMTALALALALALASARRDAMRTLAKAAKDTRYEQETDRRPVCRCSAAAARPKRLREQLDAAGMVSSNVLRRLVKGSRQGQARWGRRGEVGSREIKIELNSFKRPAQTGVSLLFWGWQPGAEWRLGPMLSRILRLLMVSQDRAMTPSRHE
jgi:hypothetical protein